MLALIAKKIEEIGPAEYQRLSHRGGAVPASLPSGEPKWQGNFSEGADHPVTPNRLKYLYLLANRMSVKFF